VQEVFFHLYSSIPSFRGDAPFAAWVFGVTRRTLASRFKRRRLDAVPLGEDEPDGLDPLASSFQREPDPHQIYECNERLSRLEAAVEHDLSAEQWQLFSPPPRTRSGIAEHAQSETRWVPLVPGWRLLLAR
jgi:DNA-directed RNA polymerase specialized sigma24 family protein